MAADPSVNIGSIVLKNPLIAGAAEHLIEEAGVEQALAAGASVVVMKSTNEVQAAKDQLDRAEYAVLDVRWQPAQWCANAPQAAFIACRSGLYPRPFEQWLDAVSRLDRKAKVHDAYVAASIILGDLDSAVAMARRVEQSGVRILELNIGTPYASQAVKGAVSTELDPARIAHIVGSVRRAVALPLWVKISGQSERVPDLARAAFEAGADSVIMAGRLLGFIPDIETMKPFLGTTLGVGGYWNLPLTCHWLSLTRAAVGPDKPLLATNGIENGLDIARVLLAGATAGEMASAVMLRGFDVIKQSLADLQDYLARKGVDARDLIGRAADERRSFAEMPSSPGRWKSFVPPQSRGI